MILLIVYFVSIVHKQGTDKSRTDVSLELKGCSLTHGRAVSRALAAVAKHC